MKSVIVSTYCEWTSYGSILQSIGLKNALISIGVEEKIVRVKDIQDDQLVLFSRDLSPKLLIRNFLEFVNRGQTVCRYKKTNKFIHENLNVKSYSTFQDLNLENWERGVYIAGSDQIWHPSINRPDFFLDYVPSESVCISYAASMGVTTVPENRKDYFKAELKKFKNISVREEDMVPVIEQFTEKKVQRNIDPTFLMSASEWRQLEKPYPIDEPFILVYLIYSDDTVNRKLRELHKLTGIKIVSVQTAINKTYADRHIYDADPAEFLWLVDHAEAVITSSFHGTAFSIIFEKKFSALINPNAKSRIQSLLNLMEINPPDISGCIAEFNIDYSKVKNVINSEKSAGLKYLEESIFNE